MCGICGKVVFDRGASVPHDLVRRMADTIVHRGPDDDGYHVSGPVGLGFRRLAIIDLALGHQPLANEDDSVWIVFNGEIYNYQELRDDLLKRGHAFRTRSDTEVIVHLYEEYGEASVEKLRGMFAFAIWDTNNRTLFAARDRAGVKPLYYRLTKNSFTFASEIKAILADPEVVPEVNPAAIDRFFTFNYLPGEETLLRDVLKLPPGHCVTVRDGKAHIRQYWDLSFSPSSRSLADAEAQLETLLDESVRLHMISDVPVGFLLSGGIDSTAMLRFAVGKTDKRLSSYTLGFSAPGITDERPYAQLAARTYGADHHEMTISAADFRDFMPQYVWHMEEPVCEPPAVALYYVSRFASQFVKVLISGEGGDEAFGGYPNYRNLLALERLKTVLGPLAPTAAGAIGAVNSRLIHSDRVAKYLPLFSDTFPDYYYSRTSGPNSLFNSRLQDVYSGDFVRHVDKASSLAPLRKLASRVDAHDTVNAMLYLDTKTWLPDDLLLKADKMTMANSVELRVPLLDHKVLEFAASLPGNFKVRGVTLKYIAKKVLAKRVPQAILDRKKTGFPVPYSSWMRNELKEWLFDTVLNGRSLTGAYFNRHAVEQVLDEHTRTGRYAKETFSLAVLELWHQAFLQKAPESAAFEDAVSMTSR